MKRLNLLCYELADSCAFFSIINAKAFIFLDSFSVKFLLIIFKKFIDMLIYFMFVFHKLTMNTFPETHDILQNLIITSAQLLQHHDMLITFLFSFSHNFIQIDVTGLVVFEKMLLSVLDYAIRA